MSKYLDYNGLLYFKEKLESLFATQAVVNTKISDPSTKSEGQLLYYNGTNWVASDAPESGVISFNGRSGVVSPTTGDYTGAQVTYDDTTTELGATNVQGAVSALKGLVDVAGDDIDEFKDVSGIVKVVSGTPTAAVAGTDYQIPLEAGVDYQVPLTAGSNITISNNVISATDTTYTAGSNVSIENGVISASDTTYEFADGYNPTTNKGATVKTVTDAIAGITTFSFHICTSSEYDPITRIPTIVSPSSSTIYLVPKSTTTTSQAYVEWAYINANWEIIGDTQISIETISNSEIDALFD